MHYENSLFSNFKEQDSSQKDQICLVLSDFPLYMDLDQLKSAIQNDFSFITSVKVVNNEEIQCWFTSMTDLVELDQGKAYGAGRAFIRESQKDDMKRDLLQNVDQKRGFLNSQQTFPSEKDYELHSFKFIPQLEDLQQNDQNAELFSQNPKLLHRPLMQRLTSLEDEIVELQQLREELNLFKDEEEHDKTFETDGVTEFDHYYTCDNKKVQSKVTQDTQSQYSSQHEQQEQQTQCEQNSHLNKKQIVMGVIEGAALTAIVYGGIKLLKNLLQ